MSKKILTKAFKYCDDNNCRLSSPRIEVLKILIANKKPMKAYEVLDKLAITLNNPKPPTVYRAIDFWHKHNFIHRIESLNAYVLCEEDHLHNGSQYLICNDCGKVIESHLCEIPSSLKETMQKKIFKPISWHFEIKGVCNQCN